MRPKNPILFFFCVISWLKIPVFFFPQRNHFYQFGEIRTITIVQRQQCAFIQFATRQAAETAAEKSFNKLIINGRRLNVKWGRSVTEAAITWKSPSLMYVVALLNVAVCRLGHRQLEGKRRMGWRRVESIWSQCQGYLVVCAKVSHAYVVCFSKIKWVCQWFWLKCMHVIN